MYKRLFVVLIVFSVSRIFPAGKWILKKNEEGITIYTRSVEGKKPKEYLAETELPTGLADVVNFMDRIELYPQWMYLCKKAVLLKKISKNERIIYYIHGGNWLVKDRDVVLHITISGSAAGGVVTIKIKSEDGIMPEDPDLVRVPQMYGSWVFTKSGENTIKVSYQVFSNPGGSIPTWVANLAVVNGPYYTLLKMRELLAKQKDK